MDTIVRASHDCGWSGEYRTEGIAEYALRRHSCDRVRMEAERVRRIAERKANIDRTVRECTHKVAYHEHGSYARFSLDHCHCDPCRDAKNEYESGRRRLKAYGHTFYVDATPAREHVKALTAAGMGWKRIARVAGVPSSCVSALLYGRADRLNHAPREKARRTTVEAILAVPMPSLDDLGAAAIVDGTGTRRRVQALAVMGWSVEKIAERSGINRQAIDRVLRGADVQAVTARAIRDAYDDLWSTPAPEGNKHDKIAASRTRRRAQAEGWVGPLAWDDDALDDPDAAPELGEKARGADLDEFMFLVRAGEDPVRAAQRCGVTIGGIEQAARRTGRDDVVAAVTAVAWAVRRKAVA